MEQSGGRPPMQWEARVAAFRKHALETREALEAAEREIDEALIENQINTIGMESAEALLAQE